MTVSTTLAPPKQTSSSLSLAAASPLWGYVADVFLKQLEPCYGDLRDEFFKTKNLSERDLELVYEGDHVAGFMSYKPHLVDFQHKGKLRQSFEIKYVGLFISSVHFDRIVSNLLESACHRAKKKGATELNITCSSRDEKLFNLLTKRGFFTVESWDSKAISGVKKHLMCKEIVQNLQASETKNLKRKREEDPKVYEHSHAPARKRAREDVKPPEVKKFQLTLRPQYIASINSGKKTIEGRIHQGIVKQFKKGDHLKLFNGKNPSESASCLIKDVRRYSSFKEMLTIEGVESCLPGVKTLDDAVKIYDALPGYAERAKTHGVAAIALEKDHG